MSRLFEDDLSRLATVVGPFEVHIPEIVDVLRGAFGDWVVDEDVFDYAYPLEGPVVILAFGLHASEERSLRRTLAWWLRCLFPVVAVEYLLKHCARRCQCRVADDGGKKLRWQNIVKCATD